MESRPALALVVAAGLALGLLLPGAGGAGPRQRADALRRQQSRLSARSHTALLGLYALDTQLGRARSQLAALGSQEAAVRGERQRVRRHMNIAAAAYRRSERLLGDQLRTLYEEGTPSAIAVVLGATSIDDAAVRLDDLQRMASQSRDAIGQTRRARSLLHNLSAKLDTRAADVRRLEAQARQTAAALGDARSARVAYLASLSRQRRLDATQIASLSSIASRIATRSRAVSPAPISAPVSPAAPPIVGEGRTLTVSATGYSLSGRTATGIPVGYGVVAVDPSVIPLGTRLSIPGYGEGVAADTGGAVQGATIDLWFPTPAQAQAWGRRTVTVTLH